MSFRAYMKNIEEKTGKTREDLWKVANEKGYVKDGKIVAPYAQLLTWLKSDIGLGHVQASFFISYLRLRTNDPKVSEKAREWANTTGYLDK